MLKRLLGIGEYAPIKVVPTAQMTQPVPIIPPATPTTPTITTSPFGPLVPADPSAVQELPTQTNHTIDFFGYAIQSPLGWLMDKFKKSLSELFIDYLVVSPIVIGVSIVVYVLVGLFSKTLARMSVVALFLYSVFVFLFM